jgi:DNA-binding MarR family transcriptional regulator
VTQPDDRRSLGMILKLAEQRLLRAKSAAVRPAGISLAQYVALDELERHPGITGATLARACLVTPQAMMIALKAMQAQDLITRTPHPRHANVLEIHLTPVGREVLADARTEAAAVDGRINNAFSPAEIDILRDLLARLAEAADPS